MNANYIELEDYRRRELAAVDAVQQWADREDKRLQGKLRDLLTRTARLPKGVRSVRPGVSLSDMLRDVERYWDRQKHGEPMTEHERHQKTRMIAEVKQLHHDGRQLYREMQQFKHDATAIIRENEEWNRMWNTAEKIAARNEGNKAAVTEINRNDKRQRTKKRSKRK